METHRLALTPGYQIEQFRIESILGKGGFGITYVAVNLQLGKQVAIKELLPDSIVTRIEGSTIVPHSDSLKESWAWARERFLDEARMLAGFSHPSIVGVHRLIEANGTVYMVMDYVEGESYEARLRRIGREPDQAALMAVIGPILSGLAEVHRSGLIHRDIKPENILIDRRGNPILIDFGSARESVGKTMTMTSIVTHGYSPIEQYQTKGKMGPWTDIYAVGAVMCRAITGEKPFVATDRLVKDEFQGLKFQGYSGYSSPFLEAVDMALQLRPENRPQKISSWEPYLRSNADKSSTPKQTVETQKDPGRSNGIPPELPPDFKTPPPLENLPPVKKKGLNTIVITGTMVLVVALFGFGAYSISTQNGNTGRPVTDAPTSQSQAGNDRLDADRDGKAKRAADEDVRVAQEKQRREDQHLAEQKRNEAKRLADAEAAAAEKRKKDGLAKATKDVPFVNSVGMEFVPLPGTNVLVSKWETRVRDYKAFRNGIGERPSPTSVKFSQTPDDPVVNVSWNDAQEFCRWLSRTEGKRYRLPTDEEWSLAVGLKNESGDSPKAKDGLAEGYPWGSVWPPPDGAGNYSPDLNVDSFKNTSPVGSFSSNWLGIFDLGGNAWEWCENQWETSSDLHVVRGGSWSSNTPSLLKSSYRTGVASSAKRDFVGFRCVLDL